MVKEGCPLSLSLFGIYVDALERYLKDENTDVGDNFILHHDLISTSLLFVVDLVFLDSLQGLYRKFDALASFYDLNKIVVNLQESGGLSFLLSWSGGGDHYFLHIFGGF